MPAADVERMLASVDQEDAWQEGPAGTVKTRIRAAMQKLASLL